MFLSFRSMMTSSSIFKCFRSDQIKKHVRFSGHTIRRQCKAIQSDLKLYILRQSRAWHFTTVDQICDKALVMEFLSGLTCPKRCPSR